MKDRDSIRREHSLRTQISEVSGLPKDVIFAAPILTMTGQMDLTLENYRGILEYTETMIRVQTKPCQIRITGIGLQVEYYTNDEMKIIGKVTKIEYLN